jgi:hypothetical protein
MTTWRTALELDSNRQVVSGDTADLSDAIGRGADLRIYTEFVHNEHIDLQSDNTERILEVAEFGVTYRIDKRWTAGVMNLRQPIALPDRFGPRPSMSFFLYNQDGTQAIARPFLDGGVADSQFESASSVNSPLKMPKYHLLDSWDGETNAPSQNFIYDFDRFRYCVNDSWREVLHHSSAGDVVSGSLKDLVDAFSSGCAIKLGIENLCTELRAETDPALGHEVFIQGGSAYYYTDQKLFIIGTHPLAKIRPAVPMKYISQGWDFGWLMVRSDGDVVYRRCDPYTLKFSDHTTRHAVRWFVR